MSLISTQPSSASRPQAAPRLPASPPGRPSLGQKTDWVGQKLGWLEKTRGRQLVVEDVMGFALLRTSLDLMRGYINGSGGLNIPAGGERLVREGASIVTDNILSGVVAKWMGNQFFDKKGTAFSNGFTNYPTLETFQALLNKPDVQSETAFIKAVADHVAPGNPGFKDTLRHAWESGLKKQDAPEQAKILAQMLGQSHYDLKNGFKLPDLLDDLHVLKTHMDKRLTNAKTDSKNGQWISTAKDSIANTVRAKNWKLGAIGLGLGATAMVPLMNVGLTKALYDINYYPGEIGLRDPLQNPDEPPPSIASMAPLASDKGFKGFIAKHFPYVDKQREKGHYFPLVLSTIPLVFAVGAFDTASRRWLNVFAKNGLTKLRNSFDFQKGWPYTSQQQMSSMFALLISSRLFCARSDNEYRERMVDSFAGWGIWILGTPLMKAGLSKLMDKGLVPGVQETCLLHGKEQDKRLRTGAEMDLVQDLLMKSEKAGKPLILEGKTITRQMLHTSRKASVWMGALSMGTTVVALGVIEPLIGILWTKKHEQNKQAAADARHEEIKLRKQNLDQQAQAVSMTQMNAANPVNEPTQLNNPAFGRNDPLTMNSRKALLQSRST